MSSERDPNVDICFLQEMTGAKSSHGNIIIGVILFLLSLYIPAPSLRNTAPIFVERDR